MKKYLLLLIYMLGISTNLFALDGHWEKITNIPTISLGQHWLDIYFLESDENYGWACGMNGLTMRTTDGGKSWRFANGTTTTNHLERIKFFDSQNGFCSGTESFGVRPGIYKSTNGGSTWKTITPDALIARWVSNKESSWGSDFIDKDNGILCAGTCDTDSIFFYRTSDGGDSWTEIKIHCENNKLCDVIMESNTGNCYAISSSVLWKSTDGGYSWDTLSVTGPAAHQEEISKYGDRILTASSGSTCEGLNENAGDIKLSKDGGRTWDRTNIGRNMYGVFLIDNNHAWAVGDIASIYYTEDAGRNWDLLNCGTKGEDFDDVFVKKNGEVWIAGKNSIYRLDPAEQTISKNRINFPLTCMNEVAYDTVWIKNSSFNSTDVDLITKTNSPDIDIISPAATSFEMYPCDSTPIAIAYTPDLTKQQIEEVEIRFDTGEKFNLIITGTPIKPTAELVHEKLSDSIYCNTNKIINVPWTVKSNFEYISRINRIGGSKEVTPHTPPPFNLKEHASNNFEFKVQLQDTGWIKSEYEFISQPCNGVQKVEFKLYGVSSIIESESQQITMHSKCDSDLLDTIPIKNKGNYKLIIPKVEIEQTDNFLSVVGWVGETGNSTTIEIGKEKLLVVKYTDGNNGSYPGKIKITNNDSTKKNGHKNPFYVRIDAFRNKTDLSIDKNEFDFGTICANNHYDREIKITNSGHHIAEIIKPNEDQSLFQFAMKKGGFPTMLRKDSSATMKIRFTPNTPGVFEDSIFVISNPCGDREKILIKANVLEPKLSFTPNRLDTLIQAGFDFKMDVEVENIGNVDLDIQSLVFDPPVSDIAMTFTPSLSKKLNVGEKTTFEFTFSPKKETEVISNLRLVADGICPLDTVIPVEFNIIDRLVIAKDDSIDFGYIKCKGGIFTKNLRLYNKAMKDDEIESIKIQSSNSPFSVDATTPIVIKTKDTIRIPISFDAVNEGDFSDTIIVETVMKEGRNQIIKIPVKATYRRTKTSQSLSIIDDKILDKCNGVISHGISFENKGTLTDTLTISISDPAAPFELIPNDKIIIEPNSTENLIVNINYPDYQTTGIKSNTINLTSLVCDSTYTIETKADLRQSIFTPLPNPIDFSAWVGENDKKSIVLENNSGLELTLLDISIAPGNAKYEFNFEKDSIINPGETYKFDITYLAEKQGDFVDTMYIKSKNNCTEIAKLILNAYSPEEIYDIDLRMSKHFNITMGDTVIVDLSLNDKVDKLVTQEIDFKFEYNMDVLYPKNVYVRNMNNEMKEINFSNKFGVIEGKIDGEYAPDIFTHSGSVMKINFQTLRAVPDTTTIFITKFDPVPAKTINWKKQHGFVDLANYCITAVENGIISMPSVKVTEEKVTDDSIILETEVENEDITLYMEFIDAKGSIISKKSAHIKQGKHSTEYSIEDIPNGLYIVKYSTQYNQCFFRKYIIAK
jgi:photosystem II stability/assembly factor-like uncharacterized protein